MRTRALRGRRLALVIAPGAVTAVELKTTWRGLRAGRIAECTLGPPAPDGAWPELEAALAELVETLRLERCVADVLLARPLAHAKVAMLPPVRRRDLRPLLQRSARRWFPVQDGAVAAEALPLARRGVRARKRVRAAARGDGAAQGDAAASPATTAMRDGAAPPGGERGATGIRALAMVAPEAVVRGTTDALARAGLRPGVVAPVSVALAALALRRARRRDARGGFALVARGAGWAERIVVERGEPRLLQPLPAEPDAARGITVDALPDTRGDAASGASSAASPHAAHERSADDDAQPPRRAIRMRGVGALPAAVAAALGAATALRDQPLLLPAPLRDAWARRVRRRAAARTSIAAALLALAAAVHLRGLAAELHAVQAARRALAPAAAEARAARAAVAAVHDMLGDVRAAERAAPRWSDLFARIADALPDSAHLLSFTADGDEVRLRGAAQSAAIAAAALAGPLADVSFASPVRPDGATGWERFELAARLPHADAAEHAGTAPANAAEHESAGARAGADATSSQDTLPDIGSEPRDSTASAGRP